LLFGPLSLGDDLLCTAVLREARQRGVPFAMFTARPELFAGNSDPSRVLPIDDYYVAALRRTGARVVQPYYAGRDPTNPDRDLLPPRHIIAEMCALAGLQGEVALRPYLTLTDSERAAGALFPRQIALHSSGLAAAIPYDTKEWGADRFVAVARLLVPHVKLIQLGSPRDPALPVAADLRGKTTLREAAAILAASAAFVGLEGFLTHLARAVDCPAVVLLGGRAPAEIFGYAANYNLAVFPPCSPCALRTGCPHDMHCMTAITPSAVAAAALSLLTQPPPRPLTSATTILP
jgi:ADP-heptose:LPS heptosyltransferase